MHGYNYGVCLSPIDESIFVGIMTRRQLRKLLDEGDISPSLVTEFYRGVRAFFVRAFQYALDNLPLNDELLKNAKFTSFMSRDSIYFSKIEYFVERSVQHTIILRVLI